MILADHQIKDHYLNKKLSIEPFEEDQLQPASYDFRVGGEAVTTSSNGVIHLTKGDFVTLKPGDFGIFITHEVIKLGPQIVGRFGLRSGLSRKGLIATTGPQIDPGYSGRLVVGLTNLTPKDIPIVCMSDFVTVEFHELEKPALKSYDGPYQNRMNITEDEIGLIADKSGIPLVKVMESMEDLKMDVHAVKKDIDNLGKTGTHTRWIIMAGLAILGLIMSVAFFTLNRNLSSSSNQPTDMQQPQTYGQPK